MATVERICACGNKFMAREADIRRGWAKSCSKSCAATATNKKTGNYQRFLSNQSYAVNHEGGEEFCDAHLFSNEEHDCNKD